MSRIEGLKASLEGLESRRLMAAPLLRVGSVTADNRGEVVIQLSERATGVKGAAVQIYTAGTDGTLFTNDDVRQTARITYSENKKQIKLTANLTKDTPYRIKLDGKSRIKAEDDGSLLDGDFSGTLASGDGRAGGNFEAVFNRDTSSTPNVIMRGSEGDITVKLRYDVAPVSANAFLTQANQKKYDNMVVTRNISGFITQMGSLQITGDGQQASDVIENSASTFPQELPRVLSNLRGTLSFARGGSGLTASNQFFFNLANNDSRSSFNNLDVADSSGDAVFTPFAEVTSASGLATMDAIAAKPSTDLTSAGLGLLFPSPTGVTDVPVNNVTQAQSGLVPTRDLVVFYRVAAVMKISAKS